MSKSYFECDCGLGDKKLEGQFKEVCVNEEDMCTHCGNYAVAKSLLSKRLPTHLDPIDYVIDDDSYISHIDLNGYESPYKTNT
jgi:hypothetical protein